MYRLLEYLAYSKRHTIEREEEEFFNLPMKVHRHLLVVCDKNIENDCFHQE